MVTSFICSDDIVSRLSLGSVRDIRNAALWLCDANERNGGTEGYSVITNRIRRWKAGDGSSDDLHWVCSLHHDITILIGLMRDIVSFDTKNSGGKYANGRFIPTRSRLMGCQGL
jgi:hypothetical protein